MVDNLVSIIVPVYNAGSYIEQTVAMVQAQTCSNWELLLVEDCSTDDSLVRIQKLAQMDKRIICLPQKVNGGAARARNAGIKAAKGQYIAFLDADDIWKKEKLEKELAFLEEKQAAFVFTSYEFGDEQAVGTGRIVHAPATLTYRQALSRTVIFTTTVMFDLTKLTKEQIQMPEVKSEDSATWWKILRQGYIAYGLDEVLAVYRRPAKSLSSNKLEAIKRIWNLYRQVEKLSVCDSIWNFVQWALRATLRRV